MTTTVILGSGIIGVSTAYYLSLSLPGSSIHLVEPSPKLFASASGFSGGFLAADWFSPSIAALGQLSFDEHRRLAEEFNGREQWGYLRSTSVSYAAGQKVGTARGDDWLREGNSRAESVSEIVAGDGGSPRWLARRAGDNVELISEGERTAQVDPLRLSQFLLKSCLDRGVQLHHPARALSIGTDLRDELSRVRILKEDTGQESDIPCTKILIAAGAWSPRVFSSLVPSATRKLPISSLAGHSLVVQSPGWANEVDERGCHAVFTTDEEGYSPEIFSRAGPAGPELYIAGLNSAALALPELPTESEIDERAISKLQKTARRLLAGTKDVEDLEILRKGLCFRPVTKKGTPILCRIPDEVLGGLKTRGTKQGGVWLASGHGPWGISLSLGTGKVMAEMIQGKPTSASVTGLGL